MEIKKFVHRLLTLLLCASMVLSYVPGISISALADDFTDAGSAETEVVEPEVAETEAAEPEEPASTEPAEIASGTAGDNITWVLTGDGHLEISGSGEMTGAPWTDWCDYITSATIGDGITSISEYAFSSCGYMRTVDIPDSVTVIGQNAFDCCYSLTSVVIPEGVTAIEIYTFYDCEALSSVVIPEGVTTIGRSAFLECESLTEITIPDSVTTIDDAAFSHNYNLVSVVMGSGVQSLGDEVFVYGRSLKTVWFKGNAPTFGENCFYSATPIAYYPADNATWTDDVMQSYGGGVNWVALGEVTGIELVDELIVLCVGQTLDASNVQALEVYEGDIYFPVAFEDLTIGDYDTSAAGRQEVTVSYSDYTATAILAVHEGVKNQLIDPSLYPESDHYYGHNLNEYKEFTVPGATSITLTFDEQTCFEDNYDSLYIYDGSGQQIAVVTGSSYGGKSLTVADDTVILRLVTDGSVSYYGYAFSEIRADAVNHTGEAVERKEPTCEEDGHTAYVFCELCQAEVGKTLIGALGHCYDGVVTPPTQDTRGYTTYTCPTCGDSYVDDYTTYDNVANGQCGENVTWVLSYEGTLTISGTGAMYEEYGVDTMTWKDAGYAIKNVIIEDGVTTIGAYAFSDCHELTSVWMADTVEAIGYDAFYYCYNLADLTIGNGVVTIDDLAFNNCTALTEVTIPDSVQTIGGGAFQYCSALAQVNMGSGVTSIGYNAFRSCDALTGIVLPDSVTTIGANAFTDCSSLTWINIPAAVTSIGDAAFYSCHALLAIEVDENNQYYSSDSCGALFDKAQSMLIQFPLGLGGEYSVPGTVTEICDEACYGNWNITALYIPGSVETIGYSAFSNCDALTSLTLGEGIVTIESYAFRDCDNLQSVVIPESVQVVDYNAFQYCGKLKNVTVNGSNLTLGTWAFSGCGELETITFNGDAPTFSYNTFSGVTATAYYPLNNTTWTEDVMQGYYGTITWVGIGEVVGMNLVSDSLIVLCAGEELTADHIQAELIREGDVRTPIDFTALTISDFDNTTVGRKEITISCGDQQVTATVAVHQGKSNQVVDPSLYPESDHNYANGLDETKVLTIPGTESITLTFSMETKTESCDYITVMNGNGNRIAEFSGETAAGATVVVSGDTVQIRLTSDYSVTYYGYSFSEIRADMVTHTGTAIKAVAPTCEEAGHTAGIWCEICEKEANVAVLPALGHSYNVVITDPTPDTQGYTTYTCATCGYSYTDNYVTYDNVANGSCGEDLTWKMSFDGVLTISGTGDMYAYGDADTMNWKDSKYPVTEVVIEDGVTSIGRSAFSHCYNLTAVTIPDSVTAIGDCAFASCDSLISVVIPDSVITIGEYAFSGCYALTSATIGNGVTTIGGQAFQECSEMTSLTIGNNVTVIGNYAFAACRKLPSVTIPDSVTTIEYCAFSNCDSLTTVNVPAGVTTIGSEAFSSCDSLISITVDEYNPNYSNDIRGVLFNKDQTTLLCAPSKITGDYEIPDGVVTVGNRAFYNCYELKSVTIPDTVTTVGEDAFEYCYALTTVNIGAGVTSIGNDAFWECYALRFITFTGNAPTIDDHSFYGVTATACYPMNNPTWTVDVLQGYGGTISWVALGEVVGIQLESDLISICVGETLNENNLHAELIREGDTRNPVAFSQLTVGEFDNSTVGRKDVAVSYGAFTTTATVAVHEGREEQVVDPSLYPESDHEYGNSLDETKVLTVPGAESITLTFSERTEFEQNWDYLYVLDGNDGQIAAYTGTDASGVSITVSGDTVKLRLTTDGSSTRYGYAFTEIKAVSITHTGEEKEGLEPTCTEAGYTAGIYCELCEATVNSIALPALGHSYDAVLTDPTPETQGYTIYTCSVCGDSYVDNYTTYDNVANGVCGEDLTWVLSFEGTLTISGTGAMNAYGSTTLPWKNTPYAVKKAVLEEGVTVIGQYAFLNCEELEEITLPSTLTTIGYSAFNNCYKLKTIEIPDSVTEIENYAFLNCNALENVELPAGIENISHGTFLNCTALTSVTIPDNVTEIHNEAFCGCTSLSEIQIPESVGYIGQSVFFNCQSLTEVDLPDSLTELSYGLFSGCEGLTQIVIPAGVTEIYDSAFNQCISLTSVTIPEGVTRIGNNVFSNCFGLKEIQLPRSLTEMGSYAFSDCKGLESFSIPEGITTVPHGLLIRCTGLKSVTIPNSITRIEEWSFAETNSLTSVTIPDSVEYLGEYCFYTSDMKSVTIGVGVTEIASNAFYCCYDLQTVTFTGDAPAIAEDAFQNVKITAYYPANNATWTETACQSYGGEITWVALGQMTGIRVVEDVIMASVGEQLDASKIEVVSVHEGGIELVLDPAVLTVSECDTSTVGKKNITVSYGGYSASITVAVHNGEENKLIDSSLYPESDHNYSDYLNEKKTLTIPGALSITLTFSDETLTESCDYIYILDRNDRQIAYYYGDHAAGATVTVPGDTVQIILNTDGSINYYGYSFSKITANVLEHTGETVEGKDATCTEDGYTSAVHCEICDQLIPQDRIPMTGHEYDYVITPPTPETDGYTTYTCLNCDHSFVDNYVDYYNVASGDTGEVSWVLAYDGTLTIHGEGRMESYDYYWAAPWMYCGYPVKHLVVEEGVENIGEYAFRNAYDLETVTLASTVSSVGYSAFECCSSLKEVNFLGYSVTINDMAFRDCHVLQSIVIPDNTSYIGAYAFENCFGLKSVTLPSMIDSIGYRTFANCLALEAIEIPGNVNTIESYAFENCDALQSVVIPASVSYIGMYALSSCDNLTSLTVNADNSAYYTDEYGVLFTKDMTQIIQAPGGLSGHYTVPASVNSIWEYAFAYCNNLTGVTIPETVSFIEQGTFFSCNALVDVDMPDTVTTIAYRAFAECYSLENIDIPNNVTAIVDYAFSECYSLGNVNFTGDAPSIDDWVFCEVSAVAYYPADNETWTEDMFRNYGGNLAWVTAGDIGIVEQPLSYVTVSGKTAVFYVEAVGSGLKYQWQFRTSSDGSWKNASAEGNKTPELLVPATPSRDGYEYRCKITDSAGNEVYTNVATLFVLGIAQQPVNVYTKPDGDVQFTVEATGMELYYQWQFRSSSKGQWADTSATGCNTATLTVPATTWRDGYQYRCLITDITGNTVLTDAVNLYVLDIETQPVNRTVTIGADAEFTVVATGGDLTYQWQYRTSAKGSWKNAGAEGNTTATLTVPATASRGGYQYRCIITDGAGNTVTSNAATLYVWGVNTQPSSKTVKAGTTVKFTVGATGTGITYQWQYRTSSSGSWKNASATGNKTKTLSVPATVARHGYQYRCKITNSAGDSTYTKAVTLYVLGIKSQPSHKTVKAGTSVTFKVSATGRSLTYQWQYKTSAKGSWKNASASSAKTAKYVLTAKAKHHGYQYRCRITDAAGNKVYTNTVNLNVLGITSQPVSKTLVADQTAKFTVTATGSDVTYQWQYKTSSSGSWKNASGTGNKTKTLSVPATVSRHGYQYRCKITDSAGNEIYTDAVNLYVLGIKTQPANKTVKVGATAKFTVKATGNGLTYQWQYKTSAKGSWKNASGTGSKTKTLSVSGTASKNGYQYRCKITDSAGNVIYTDAAKLTVKK